MLTTHLDHRHITLTHAQGDQPARTHPTYATGWKLQSNSRTVKGNRGMNSPCCLRMPAQGALNRLASDSAAVKDPGMPKRVARAIQRRRMLEKKGLGWNMKGGCQYSAFLRVGRSRSNSNLRRAGHSRARNKASSCVGRLCKELICLCIGRRIRGAVCSKGPAQRDRRKAHAYFWLPSSLCSLPFFSVSCAIPHLIGLPHPPV